MHIGHLNLFSSGSRRSHTSALLQIVPLGSLLRRGPPNDRGIEPRSRPEPSTSSLFDRSRICKTPPCIMDTRTWDRGLATDLENATATEVIMSIMKQS